MPFLGFHALGRILCLVRGLFAFCPAMFRLKRAVDKSWVQSRRKRSAATNASAARNRQRGEQQRPGPIRFRALPLHRSGGAPAFEAVQPVEPAATITGLSDRRNAARSRARAARPRVRRRSRSASDQHVRSRPDRSVAAQVARKSRAPTRQLARPARNRPGASRTRRRIRVPSRRSSTASRRTGCSRSGPNGEQRRQPADRRRAADVADRQPTRPGPGPDRLGPAGARPAAPRHRARPARPGRARAAGRAASAGRRRGRRIEIVDRRSRIPARAPTMRRRDGCLESNGPVSPQTRGSALISSSRGRPAGGREPVAPIAIAS